MSEALPSPSQENSSPAPTPKPPRRFVRGLGMVLILFSALVAWFLIIGFMGYQSGQTLRSEKQQAELSNQISKQIELAKTDMAEERYALAITRLEWVLERDSNNREASTLKETAASAIFSRLHPTSAPVAAVPAASPTTPSLPTPTAGPITSPDGELLRIRNLIVAKAWEDTIVALLTFQRQFPSYERNQTDQLLYDSYINYGLELLNGTQVELGIFYLAQAEQLGDLPQAVVDARTWAELYVQGIAFYGVNWEATAYYFRDLCLAAPFYQNSCDELYSILLAAGDTYATTQDWCQAQSYYEEALQYGSTSPALTEKLQQANTGCALATPTPNVITNTTTITDSERNQGIFFSTPTPKSP